MAEEEQLARAAEGVEMIDAVLRRIGPAGLVADLAKMDEYVREVVLPRHGDLFR